ncbi:D-alanyl-D-alanine carboxypeptidase/D-alanyl-D-alanine endopeptidase [Yoonia sp. 208BN28-4]|uniref:D-alanyl-D-alanine carboxypeptidase/D-alanyl-D-alanine endopeptidase n=1 Tax=Yoonia sp. 208BN28-4 TaxID=3126505 RepID=UPI0030A9995F
MTLKLTRRALLTTAVSSVATLALAEAPLTSLRPTARPGTDMPILARIGTDEMLADANLGGIVGFVVADAATGEVLEANEADAALPPASVTKAVTALYALEILGSDFKFRTRVLGTAPVVDGVLDGDLILAGGGNPNFLTDDMVALVQSLKDSGLREVRGDFHVWGEALPYLDEIDEEQQDHLGYNPSISGLNLNFNRVHFEWKRQGASYDVSMDARSETIRPRAYTSRMRVVDRSLPIYTYAQAGGVDEWTVARRALGDAGSRWLPVRNPRLYAGDVFQTLARAQGIVLKNPQIIDDLPTATEIVGHDSEDLRAMMRSMLLYSTNITAEGAGLTATAAQAGQARGLRTSALSMTQWARAKAAITPTFADHSGLSDQSAISAADMAKLLRAPGVDGMLRPIMKRIAMTDAERREIPNFPGEVRAKTGTLNFVTTLAGYVDTGGGRDLVFAIFAAEPEARARGKLTPDEQPAGSVSWNRRAKRLQQRLLQRWTLLYGADS